MRNFFAAAVIGLGLTAATAFTPAAQAHENPTSEPILVVGDRKVPQRDWTAADAQMAQEIADTKCGGDLNCGGTVLVYALSNLALVNK